MSKKIVLSAAVVALAVFALAPSASATCGSPKSATTFDAINGVYAYWLPTAAVGVPGGQAWQLGAPGTYRSDSGTLTCNPFYFTSGKGNLNLDLGACGAGCPANGATLATLATNAAPGHTDFLLATIAETPASTNNFEYSSQGNHNMVVLQSPVITASGPRSVNTVPVTLNVPSHAAGLYGPNASTAVSGYRIVYALSVADPGPDASLYTALTTIAAAGGGAGADTAVNVDCTDPTATKDAWVATQLSLEGGAVLSSQVSARKRIHCAGTLAEPKYKPVPRKNGIGQTKN